MSKAMHWGLIGLAVGLTTYILLLWLAKRTEREAKTEDALRSAHALKILAVVDLILIPMLMYYFGMHSTK